MRPRPTQNARLRSLAAEAGEPVRAARRGAWRCAPAAAALLAASIAIARGAPPGQAELPRQTVETGVPQPAGRVVTVRPGGDFQAALDAARAGDVIALPAGAVFRGPFRLPRKAGSGWIVVRTAAPDGKLPPPGTRAGPSHAALMPKLESGADAVLDAEPGAHHFRFIGVEIRPAAGTYLPVLVQLGEGQTRAEETPHHIIFDRCYLHGDPAKGTRRGIALNSRFTAVVDSTLSDFKEAGADSQALCGWNGPGPFAILNNDLQAAGENVMFGGADPSIPGLVPSDIEIRRNRFSKPLAWKAGEPGFEGTQWTVKNLFELKNARRVVVEGNLFEHNWAQAQNGFAILFTVRNQDGGAPWSSVEDVTFVNNIVRGATAGVNILGRDAAPTGSGRTARVILRNNLFEEIGGGRWGGAGALFQILEGASDVTIEHNTAVHAGSIIMAEGVPHERFVFRDNIVMNNEYGINGTGTATGLPTLKAYFPGALVRGNVIVGGEAGRYPAGNEFPGAPRAVGFRNAGQGDYSLAASSPFRGAATDGRDPGVDVAALRRSMGGAR
jgi:hypothetical protein